MLPAETGEVDIAETSEMADTFVAEQTTFFPQPPTPKEKEITPEEALAAAKELGIKTLEPSKLEAALKLGQWYIQLGPRKVAAMSLMDRLNFWQRVAQIADPVFIEKMKTLASDGKLPDIECQGYLTFRLDCDEAICNLTDRLVKLSDGPMPQIRSTKKVYAKLSGGKMPTSRL